MTTLCAEFTVSRKTAYKWVSRYLVDGPVVEDRSRAPHEHHQRVDPVAVEALLMARRAHPHWVSDRRTAAPLLHVAMPAPYFDRLGLPRLGR
jgi:hypothetical protein